MCPSPGCFTGGIFRNIQFSYAPEKKKTLGWSIKYQGDTALLIGWRRYVITIKCGMMGKKRLKLKARKREYEVRQYRKTAGTPKLLFKSDSVT